MLRPMRTVSVISYGKKNKDELESVPAEVRRGALRTLSCVAHNYIRKIKGLEFLRDHGSLARGTVWRVLQRVRWPRKARVEEQVRTFFSGVPTTQLWRGGTCQQFEVGLRGTAVPQHAQCRPQYSSTFPSPPGEFRVTAVLLYLVSKPSLKKR